MKINGEHYATSVLTLSELLVELEIDPPLIAVEINRYVIPKSAYLTTVISHTDDIEIIHAIGGG